MRGGLKLKKKETIQEKNKEAGNGGSLRGKAPETFNGNRAKLKEFLNELQIYFQLNQKKPNIKNCYSRCC